MEVLAEIFTRPPRTQKYFRKEQCSNNELTHFESNPPLWKLQNIIRKTFPAESLKIKLNTEKKNIHPKELYDFPSE